ncbi:MAG: hypothetical protein V2I27_09435 [Erythrobacter sp.]|nr:hypothetical protein [Erythrobacter sp.]
MTTETLTTEQMRAKWDATFERLRAAESAAQEYIAATDPLHALERASRDRVGIDALRHQPDFLDRLNALRAESPAYFVPKFMNDHRDSLVDAVVEIEGELMALPSPDLTALHWKVDKTAGDSWEGGYLDQMRADMVRLMGPVPTAAVA